MNIKETLNKVYGKSAATNAPIKDKITQEDVMNAIKTIEEEEWIWVKGFKGTDKNMQCKDDYQYELGKQFDLDADVEPAVCSKGFHFCKNRQSLINSFIKLCLFFSNNIKDKVFLFFQFRITIF